MKLLKERTKKDYGKQKSLIIAIMLGIVTFFANYLSLKYVSIVLMILSIGAVVIFVILIVEGRTYKVEKIRRKYVYNASSAIIAIVLSTVVAILLKDICLYNINIPKTAVDGNKITYSDFATGFNLEYYIEGSTPYIYNADSTVNIIEITENEQDGTYLGDTSNKRYSFQKENIHTVNSEEEYLKVSIIKNRKTGEFYRVNSIEMYMTKESMLKIREYLE